MRNVPESTGDGHYRWVDPDEAAYRSAATESSKPAVVLAEENDVPVETVRRWTKRPSIPSPRAQPSTGDRPGDRFNASTSWSEVLEPAGWFPVAQRGEVTHWCRPGKRRRGTSATTTDTTLYVFTTEAAPFEPERPYDRFGAFAAIHHHGDLAAAARALRVSV